ncbi:MAG TPA: MFS transporter, partial [Acidimicrobiia bacterium]
MTADPPRRPPPRGLPALLLAAMAAATLLPIAFGIVAAFMIDDLGISRERFGLAVTVNLLAGAAFSLFAGRFTD